MTSVDSAGCHSCFLSGQFVMVTSAPTYLCALLLKRRPVSLSGSSTTGPPASPKISHHSKRRPDVPEGSSFVTDCEYPTIGLTLRPVPRSPRRNMESTSRGANVPLRLPRSIWTPQPKFPYPHKSLPKGMDHRRHIAS